MITRTHVAVKTEESDSDSGTPSPELSDGKQGQPNPLEPRGPSDTFTQPMFGGSIRQSEPFSLLPRDASGKVDFRRDVDGSVEGTCGRIALNFALSGGASSGWSSVGAAVGVGVFFSADLICVSLFANAEHSVSGKPSMPGFSFGPTLTASLHQGPPVPNGVLEASYYSGLGITSPLYVTYTIQSDGAVSYHGGISPGSLQGGAYIGREYSVTYGIPFGSRSDKDFYWIGP